MRCLKFAIGASIALAAAASAIPAAAGDYYSSGSSYSSSGRSYSSGGTVPCYKCPPPRNYDSQEVVKQSKDVDHSQVIETQTVVPSKRVIETNHLIIHENETRNVGTIVHKNTIIEKEQVFTKQNVDHKTINTEVNLVENKYDTQRKRVVEEHQIPGEVRNLPNCDCDNKRPVATPYGNNTVSSYGMASRYTSSR